LPRCGRFWRGFVPCQLSGWREGDAKEGVRVGGDVGYLSALKTYLWDAPPLYNTSRPHLGVLPCQGRPRSFPCDAQCALCGRGVRTCLVVRWNSRLSGKRKETPSNCPASFSDHRSSTAVAVCCLTLWKPDYTLSSGDSQKTF